MNIVVQLEFTVINMECGDKPANPDQTAWNPAVTAVAYFVASSKSPPILDSCLDSWKMGQGTAHSGQADWQWTYRANHWRCSLTPRSCNPLFHFDERRELLSEGNCRLTDSRWLHLEAITIIVLMLCAHCLSRWDQ